MKQNLYLFIALSIILFYSCDQSAKDAKSGSDSSKSRVDTTGLPKVNHLESFFVVRSPAKGDHQDQLVPPGVSDGYQRDYINHPAIFDISGGKVYGFMLDTASDANHDNIDFNLLKKLKGVDNIYIKFGIKGRYTDASGNLGFIYTVMVVPIGKDRKPIQNTVLIGAQTVTGSDYDVACPCVNGQGCCPK